MTLPLALVDRWPGEFYKQQHQTIESALKHNVADALTCYKELADLRHIHNSMQKAVYKDSRQMNKRSNISGLITEKEDRLFRLMKFSDYPAMIMASYPESTFLDRSRYWEIAEQLDKPVLIRGISSARIGIDANRRGQDYYFVETGYLGNYPSENNRTGRKVYHRIVKNDMQHRTVMDVPPDRWNDLVSWNPALDYKGWRRPGSKILVVVPSEKPFQFYGTDRNTWLDYVRTTLSQYTDREIVWREKAGRGERTSNTIYDALNDDIWALVTYNSIATVEAVASGVPAFGLAPTAADPVCSQDLTQIENPYRPDEWKVYAWLRSIAYSQFSLDEILTGKAWQMVLDNVQRPTINI